MQWNCFVLTFHILPQIFEGNGHYDTPEVRRFDEIVTQHIRVFPERWSPAGIGMRMEVLGCDLPGRSAHTWMIGETTHRWNKVACVDKWTIPHSSRNESGIHLHIYDKLNDHISKPNTCSLNQRFLSSSSSSFYLPCVWLCALICRFCTCTQHVQRYSDTVFLVLDFFTTMPESQL